jgi:REP element-mobilizing transposase RayT
MARKTTIAERDGIYFITFTCLHWLPLFEHTNSYHLVYKWFDHLKSKGHFIVGYAIMPNHLHVLIAFKKAQQSINTIVSNGKRFMAYELVKALTAQKEYALLQQLSLGVSASDKKRGKLHQVFAPSFDCKECRKDFFIEQKLAYMHRNPCTGKWNLAASPEQYAHSSASFYLTGKGGVYEVMNYKALEDIDLTS